MAAPRSVLGVDDVGERGGDVSRQSWEREVQERWQKYRWWAVAGIVAAVLIIVAGVIAGNKSESGGRSGDERISSIKATERAEYSARTLAELRAAARAKKRRQEEARKAREGRPFHNEDRACGSYSGKDRFACEDSYEICSAEAPRVVEKSYREEGPNFEEWAIHYAKETYTGHVNPYEDLVWQAGYAGCLEAMSAEYEKRYG